MTRLVPLNRIPYAARRAEADERAKWPTRAMALDAAFYKIVDADGCYSGPFPGLWGWVLTREAAEAISQVRTEMPDGSTHCRASYRLVFATTEALGDYMEAIARGSSPADALAAYEAHVANRDVTA